MKDARTARVLAKYENVDISEDISPFLKSFSVSEVLGGEADTADITLEDREELWMGGWFPERGATMDLSISLTDWEEDGDTRQLPFGKFEIDGIANSAPPHEAKIKMVSIPNNAGLRSIEKTRSWEKAQLSEIAQELADEAELKLFYDTKEDPTLERVEQNEQSDLSFLLKLCRDAGLALKVSDKTIIIFDVEEYEKADPALTITKGKSAVISYNAGATIHEIYKACHVKYKHGSKGELIEYTYTAPDKESGMTLQINEKVETLEEAERLAKKKLREKNREEFTVSMTLPGNFALLASNTIELSGFHVYDGKYLITKSTHEISGSGYTTKIELRRCLDEY